MASSNPPKEFVMKKSTLAVLLLAGLAAQSASAADWFVRGGLTNVNPDSDNGSLAGGALDTSIGSNTQLGLTFGYHINPNLAIEVLAATPFSHDVSLNGAKAGSFKHLPPTVSLQYYFNADGKVSPFVGAGLNYTWTFSEDSKTGGPISGTDLSIGNSFGFAGQLGLRFAASKDWDVVVDARYIDISADVSVNGANVGEATVDPMVYSIMVGKRF
jgi:outer membrane protein